MTLDKEDIYDIAKAVVKVIEDKDMMKSEEKDSSNDVNDIVKFTEVNPKVQIGTLNPGDVFKIADREWVLLEHCEQLNGCFVITKNVMEPISEFDASTNNWRYSNLRCHLQSTLKFEIEDYFHDQNTIMLTERNLIALDGTTYGSLFEEISLLTLDEYRKYRKYIEHIMSDHWLLTPDSTTNNMVCFVDISGRIDSDYYGNYSYVCPVCTLKQGALVEKVSG